MKNVKTTTFILSLSQYRKTFPLLFPGTNPIHCTLIKDPKLTLTRTGSPSPIRHSRGWRIENYLPNLRYTVLNFVHGRFTTKSTTSERRSVLLHDPVYVERFTWPLESTTPPPINQFENAGTTYVYGSTNSIGQDIPLPVFISGLPQTRPKSDLFLWIVLEHLPRETWFSHMTTT